MATFKNHLLPSLCLVGALVLSGSAFAAQVIPINDRVLVELDGTKNTPGGILLPKDEKGARTGVVADRGDQVIHVQPGDRILFGKFSGTEITIDGIEYAIMKEEDILGIVQ